MPPPILVMCDPHCGSGKKLEGPGSDAQSACEEEEEEESRADAPHLKEAEVDVSPLGK